MMNLERPERPHEVQGAANSLFLGLVLHSVFYVFFLEIVRKIS